MDQKNGGVRTRFYENRYLQSLYFRDDSGHPELANSGSIKAPGISQTAPKVSQDADWAVPTPMPNDTLAAKIAQHSRSY